MSAQYSLGDTIHVAGVLHIVIGYSEISGQLVTVTRTLTRVPNIYVEFEPLGPVRSVAQPEPEPEPKPAPVVNLGRWTHQEIEQVIAMHGQPVTAIAAALGKTAAAVKRQRRRLREAGRLPGAVIARCHCGQPQEAKGLCHKHYQTARLRLGRAV